MKKLWVIVGAVLLIGLVVASAVFGPRLYHRFFPRRTPLGHITSAEKVNRFLPADDPESITAEPGQQLWVVNFDAENAGWQALADGRYKNAYLIDDVDKYHRVLAAKIDTQNPPRYVTGWRLVFSLPQGRQPRYINFSFVQIGPYPSFPSAPVPLPSVGRD